MIYQVMVRISALAAWEPFATATADPFAVMRLIQRANQQYREVTVVQAASEVALDEVARRLARGETPDASASPAPSVTATPRISFVPPDEAELDAQRWRLEDGDGGDHDRPYAFSLPSDPKTLGRWLQLQTRRER